MRVNDVTREIAFVVLDDPNGSTATDCPATVGTYTYTLSVMDTAGSEVTAEQYLQVFMGVISK